jgi:hypothetical protein
MPVALLGLDPPRGAARARKSAASPTGINAAASRFCRREEAGNRSSQGRRCSGGRCFAIRERPYLRGVTTITTRDAVLGVREIRP